LGVGVEAIHGFMTTLMHPSCLARNALFFEIGKAAIGFYIGKQGLESTYGAAASIVVVLIWVYYTSQIILMGAEITHSYAAQRLVEAHGVKTVASRSRSHRVDRFRPRWKPSR
jgi:uncharacterized BrkB/YihY/UPF0761 family membrane protein